MYDLNGVIFELFLNNFPLCFSLIPTFFFLQVHVL